MNKIFFSSEEKTWGLSRKCKLQETRKSRNFRGSAPSKVSGSHTFTFSGLAAGCGWRIVRMPEARSEMTCKNLSPSLGRFVIVGFVIAWIIRWISTITSVSILWICVGWLLEIVLIFINIFQRHYCAILINDLNVFRR